MMRSSIPCRLAAVPDPLRFLVLESRTVPAVTATLTGTELAIVSDDAADTITVSLMNGLVKVNGQDPAGGPVAATVPTMLSVSGGGGNDIIDLTAVTKNSFPALGKITIDGGTGSDLVSFSGTGAKATINFATTTTIDFDGTAISIQEIEHIRFLAATTNLTINYQNSASEIISDDTTPADGISRTTNSTLGFITDFRHPTGSLRINGTTGNESVVFQGLDTSARPASFLIDGENGTDSLQFIGNAVNTLVALDPVSQITIDGLSLSFAGFESARSELTTTNLTFNLRVGATQLFSDDSIAGDGFSRSTDLVRNTKFDYRTPTGTFTINGNDGGEQIIISSLDLAVVPSVQILDGRGGTDTIEFQGSSTNTVITFAATSSIALDTRTYSFINFEILNAYQVSQLLTFNLSPGSTETVTDNGTANDGISRITNSQSGAFTNFRHPTTILTLNGGIGEESILVAAFDSVNTPSAIAINGGVGNDLIRVTPLVGPAYNINGGDGIDTFGLIVGTATGISVTGPTNGAGTIVFSDRAPINFVNIESFQQPLVDQNRTQQFAAATGNGGNGQVIVFDKAGQEIYRLDAFPSETVRNGVRVAMADVNGDGIIDLIVGTGPGTITQVRIFDGASKNQIRVIDAFESSFLGGVYVAAGDIDSDGAADIIITPDEGGGPRVRIFSGRTGAQIADFFGIEDPNFRGGARATAADMNGDGRVDLIIAAGFGGGPRVALFDGKSFAPGRTPTKLRGDFFVFEETLRNGAFVSAGDVNGDGFADLVAGGGPGGGPRVYVLNGRELLAERIIPIANFFVGDVNNRGGIRVAVKDLDGDSFGDIMTGSGTNAFARIQAFAGSSLNPTDTPTPSLNLQPFPLDFTGGIFVG